MERKADCAQRETSQLSPAATCAATSPCPHIPQRQERLQGCAAGSHAWSPRSPRLGAQADRCECSEQGAL
eukprot:5760198-Alexandrium_andersonii.AAC.1